jgi:hypothetical protein
MIKGVTACSGGLGRRPARDFIVGMAFVSVIGIRVVFTTARGRGCDLGLLGCDRVVSVGGRIGSAFSERDAWD